jgi:succinate dehydrogenase / fumarate reductase cytochrome b subunit
MAQLKERPVYLDLRRIRQPVTAIVSIVHRITGVLLALATPVLIYLLASSVASPEGFRRTLALFETGIVKSILLILIWLIAFHLLAGIRYLLIDIDVGVELRPARRGAWVVHGLSVLIVLIALGVML